MNKPIEKKMINLTIPTGGRVTEENPVSNRIVRPQQM